MTHQKIKVLLVDDEPDFTGNLSMVLSHRGFESDTATDGLAALSYAAKKHYDVVILDIKMPGISGIQVLTEMKRFAPSTQVILLTGHFSATDEEDTLRSGAYAYLLKPYPVLKLVDLISAAAGCRAEHQGRHLCPL